MREIKTVIIILLLITAFSLGRYSARKYDFVIIKKSSAPAKMIKEKRKLRKPIQGKKRVSARVDSAKLWELVKNAPQTGDKEVEITLIEFSDFQCPFSRRAQETIDQLMEKYPIKRVFKNYPLPFHQNAMIAHQSAMAAYLQGKFWEMKKLLFENQDKLDKEHILEFAKQIGLDMDKFQKDLESEKVKELIERDKNQARSLGINATPTFLINTEKIVGAAPLEEFENTIQKLLGEKPEKIQKN